MKKRLILMLACFYIAIGAAMAQTASGVVLSDEDGTPIIGASVKVVGTKVGAATDIEGRFSVKIPGKDAKLEISYIGMVSQTVEAGQDLTIYLKSETNALDEVMVVAYGTQKKSSFTGSAAEIKAEKISAHVASNVTSALAGSTPGVQFTSSNGDPTDNGATINIRGIGTISASSDPLYIVDGMPYEGVISNINPQDIESMTVLKDASASAIYGARGANGVIIITTKRGKSADAEIKFDAKFGSNSRGIPQYDVISDPGQYFETHFRRMYNSQVLAGMSPTEAYANVCGRLFDENDGGLGYQIYTIPEGQNLIGTNFRLNPNAKLGYSDGEYYYTPDNWYDETFHSSFRQEYNISASGQGNRVNYYVSAGYLNDKGVVNNSGFKRYTGRTNLEFKAKKWISLSAQMGYTHTDSDKPSYEKNNWGSSGNLFYIVNGMAPIYPLYVRNADGTIKTENGRIIYDTGQTNMRRAAFTGNAVRDNEYNSSKTYRDMFNGVWGLTLTPVKGLSLSAKIGVNSDNRRTNELYSTYGSAAASDGYANVYSLRQMGVNNQYLGNYVTDFNGQDIHHLDAMLGYEMYRYKYQYSRGANDHLYDPTIGELGNAGGNGDSKYVTSYTHNYLTQGVFTRVQYDYMERYFVSGSYRRDASSRFAPGHRWGNFYSISGAWQLSKENWFKVDAIDYLKFKISYGEQGNDNLKSYYPYADTYTTSYNAETNEYSISLSHKGNDELTWEKSKSFNTGFDFGLWKGRLSGSLEFYNRTTSDLLYNKNTPISSGIVTGSYPINVGSVVNRGVEFSASAVLVKTRDASLTFNLNITSNSNKITSLDKDIDAEGIKGGYWIRRVGGSVYQAYMYKSAGVCHQEDVNDPETSFTEKDLGRAMFWKHVVEKNEQGEIVKEYDAKTCNFSEATKYDLGTTLPKVYGGFGISATFFNFDVSAQFQYQLGGKYYDANYQALMWTQDNRGENMHKDLLKAWSPENPNSNIPRLDTEYAVSQSSVDTYLTRSNYLSLNNVSVGYTIPKSCLRKIGISGLRVYFGGENLFMLSARKGMDPRFSFGLGSYTAQTGYASSNYSALRTITGGFTLTL